MVPKNEQHLSDENFDEEILNHLKKMGLAFPESPEELDHFLITINSEKVSVPINLPTGADILRTGLLELPNHLNDSTDETIEDHLAQAAREGKQISDEVDKKMKKDRQKSEEDSDNAEN